MIHEHLYVDLYVAIDHTLSDKGEDQHVYFMDLPPMGLSLDWEREGERERRGRREREVVPLQCGNIIYHSTNSNSHHMHTSNRIQTGFKQ